MVKRHFILFALAFAAALSGVAKTFDVDISTGRPAASNEAYYHGETIEFRAVRGRSVVTNVEYSCVYYQTNGMDSVWWHTDGLVFHPTNDVGAASYRFFLEGRDDLGRDWHANGLLRLLPSPGFTPNTIELPVARLDFAAVDVLNPPWTDPDYSTSNTALVETIEATAPAPGNYAAVSNAAMSAMNTAAGLVNGSITAEHAMTAETADESLTAETLKPANQSQQPRDAEEIFAQLDAATTTNALQDTAIAEKQDKLPYPTNAIPYAAISGKPTNVSSFNNDAGYLTGYTESDPTIKSWAKANTKPTYTASEVGAATAEDVYRIVAGTNVILVVTNYNSAVHAPAMKLQHLDPGSGQYVTYWDEQRRHGMTLTNAMDYTDAAAAAELSRADAAYAPRAWSRVTSGLGVDAPDGTTFISTPVTHISGGFEFEKKITARGTVWTLCSTSLAAGSTTNGFFEISALDGTPVFSVEKTDSVLVGVNASAIAVVDNACVISVPAVADTHPFARVATTLVNPTWYRETEDGMPTQSPATVSWSGQSGAWVATVDFGSSPQGFVFFEYLQEGGVKIVNSAVVDLSQGVHYGGATYMPTVSGNELKFIRQ